MKEFFTGLVVLLMLLLLSSVGLFLLPFIVVLGFFVKWLISIIFLICAIWVLGKVTLWSIERARK